MVEIFVACPEQLEAQHLLCNALSQQENMHPAFSNKLRPVT